MSASFKIDPAILDGVAVGVSTGNLTPADLKRHAATFWRQSDVAPTRILWDLTNAHLNFARSEIQALAELTRTPTENAQLTVAFVVAGDLQFGLLRMFHAFRESYGAADHVTGVFRKRDGAVKWLAEKIS